MTPEVALTLFVAGALIVHYSEHAFEHGAVLLGYSLGLLGITAILISIGAILFYVVKVWA